MTIETRCYTNASKRLEELVVGELRRLAGESQPRRIVIKPNWVLHETDPAFPISALVTDARLVEAVVSACVAQFPGAESILVGDCPLQYGDWPLMCRQGGLDRVMERFAGMSGGVVAFRDLRKDVFEKADGSFLVESEVEHGDPRGYCEVKMGARSHLEPISDQADRFAVNDYSASVTKSNHIKGDHRYLVSQSILDADLLINLPKWKSHSKSGITCALKNVVGINGDKAYLPHFRRGAPKWGGDEYKDENRWLYFAQTFLREKLQKRSQLAFKLLKPGWEILKKLRGIETELKDRDANPRRFYTAGGGWYGNQTLWRMIYDLNLIVQCVDASGKLQESPQRDYICFVDGLIGGEGNGPLQPLPREIDWFVAGNDPFAIDTALSWFMGFSPERIPVTACRREYLGPDWGDFDFESLEVEIDGDPVALLDSPINHRFAPAPGWKNHVER